MSTSKLSPHQIVVLSLIAERDGSDKSPYFSRMDIFNKLCELQSGMFKQTLDNMLDSLERRGLIERFSEDRVDARGVLRPATLLKPTKKGSEVAQANVRTGKLEKAQRALEARLRT